jgi:HK97 family phage major capsid protein
MIHAHQQRMLAGAIELKDGEEDPNEIVTKALADLQKTVDERLKAMETKGIDPKLLERLGAVELKLNRPGLDKTEKPGKEQRKAEKKAFEAYVRKGVLTPDETKSLRVSDDTAGGYLAPEQFVTELDRNVVLFSPVRSVARVLTTGSPEVRWPKRTGGMTAQWTGETGPRTETTVTFGNTRYPVSRKAKRS